jgi:hypothetical protein
MQRPFVVLLTAAALLSVPGNAQTTGSESPSPGSTSQQPSRERKEKKETTAQKQDNVTVVYTSALFGYYRMEPGETKPLTPVQTLLTALRRETKEPRTLLLGMGDNFGPEMGASVQLENKDSPDCKMPLPSATNQSAPGAEPTYPSPTQGDVPIPIVLYKDGARVAKTAVCDNVARFLLNAGYRAIVPGREDFLYSSTWLAYIAHDLHPDGTTPDLAMLAANLELKYKGFDPPKDRSVMFKKQDYEKWNPLLFAQCQGSRKDARLDCPIDVAKIEQKDVGYTIVDLNNASNAAQQPGDPVNPNGATPEPIKVLVVGVVGKETMGAISPANKRMCFLASDSTGTDLRSIACNRKDLKGIRTDKDALMEFEVETSDPLKATLEALRTAERDNKDIKYRVLMAQMPRTEAEELVAKLRSTKETMSRFDLVISEGQLQQSSPSVDLTYQRSGDEWDMTPVVTPYRAYRSERCDQTDKDCKHGYLPWGLFRPDSRVTLSTGPTKRTVTNCPPPVQNRATDLSKENGASKQGAGDTTMHLLMVALDTVAGTGQYSYSFVFRHFSTARNFTEVHFSPTASECANTQGNEELLQACEAAITKYLLVTMHQFSHADVALLERRDVFLGYLPSGYDDYHAICDLVPVERRRDVCELRVALDRVLWKGDYSQRVMMSGKDIQSMLAMSKQKKDEEEMLKPNDTFDQWLISFGIVSPPETSPAPSSDLFAIPAGPECRDYSPNDYAGSGAKKAYCVNGEAIRSDHAYFIVTSDHLASDTQVYATMAGLLGGYKELRRGYLTERITDFLAARYKNPGARVSASGSTMPLREPGVMQNAFSAPSDSTSSVASRANKPPAEDSIQTVEENQQQRGIMQIDLAKVVAAYNARLPQSSDQNIADKFQGVTDTRASSPSSAEVDLEAKVRVLRKLWHDKDNRFSFGVGSQDEFAYDRSVQGNLSGNAVNASYPLNSATAGGFLQFGFKIRPKKKLGKPGIFDGKTMIVIAPFQYQRQIVGSYLFFPFASPSKAQLTLHSPVVDGFSHRIGWRGEGTKYRLWDPGTYAEIGWQVVVQNNLLSSVKLSTPSPSGTVEKTCNASSTLTINNCFKKAGYVVGDQTLAFETPAGPLHSKGLYWDIHWQKGIVPLSDKNGITFSFDSSGDWFVAKPGLPSQTGYDIPLKLTLTFPVLRNFGIGPTYSTFFYSNQVNQKSLFVQNVALSARWYFDRDAAVRLDRQTVFSGPSTADETKTSRIK